MTSVERIGVEPRVLRWARETAGYDLSSAAKRLGVRPDVVAQWEIGEVSPTVNQLRKSATLYRRPLAVLLLEAPPEESDPPRDFRVVGPHRDRAWTPALHAEFKRAVSQREVFLELLELSPESLPITNDRITIGRDRDPETAAHIIRDALAVQDWPASVWREPHDLLNKATAAAEGLGVIVIQTRGVEPSEMQGFSISEWPYPLIALNGKDPPRRRLFTLLHEFSHLGLNVGGICDLHEPPPGKRDVDDGVEFYCNQVAAAVLMPKETFLSDPLVQGNSREHVWTLDELGDLSRTFGASSEAVLIRLINLDKAEWSTYELRKPQLETEYERHRRDLKEKQRKSKGGPNFYVVKARNLGHGYVGSVLDAYHNRAISSRDVADYLDVRFDQLPELERRIS